MYGLFFFKKKTIMVCKFIGVQIRLHFSFFLYISITLFIFFLLLMCTFYCVLFYYYFVILFMVAQAVCDDAYSPAITGSAFTVQCCETMFRITPEDVQRIKDSNIIIPVELQANEEENENFEEEEFASIDDYYEDRRAENKPVASVAVSTLNSIIKELHDQRRLYGRPAGANDFESTVLDDDMCTDTTESAEVPWGDLDEEILDALLMDGTVRGILKLHRDSSMSQSTMTTLCEILVGASESFANVWKAYGRRNLVGALLRRALKRGGSDAKMKEIIFLQCYAGCCLVSDPKSPKDATRRPIFCSDGLDEPNGRSKVKFVVPGWSCAHCHGSRIRLWRYSTIAGRIQRMYADPKLRKLLLEHERVMEAALKRVNDAIDAGKSFQDLENEDGYIYTDFYSGENFYDIVLSLRKRGIYLQKWDQIVTMNYDGVEVVSKVSGWPLLIMFFGLGVYDRHEKDNIHMCGLAGAGGSPKDINSYLLPWAMEMHALQDGVKVEWRDDDGTLHEKRVRVFVGETCQDLMALLKTTGLAISSGKCACPCCMLVGLQLSKNDDSSSTKSYMPRSVLPDNLTADNFRAIMRPYERTKSWMQRTWVAISTLWNTPRKKGQGDVLSKQSGIKRGTPLWLLPSYVSMPGAFVGFDAMHTLHHNCWTNMINLLLGSLAADERRVLVWRADNIVLPHDLSKGYQQLFQHDDISKPRYLGMKAADKYLMVVSMIPTLLFGLIPPRLWYAVCAFGEATAKLCAFNVSADDVNTAEKMFFKVFCILDDAFKPTDMKVTLHLMLHAAEWVRKNGPLRFSWLYSFERFNQEITRAVTGNRFPIIVVMRRFRIAQWFAITSGKVRASASVKVANLLRSLRERKATARWDFLQYQYASSSVETVRCWLGERHPDLAEALNKVFYRAKTGHSASVDFIELSFGDFLPVAELASRHITVGNVYGSLYNAAYADVIDGTTIDEDPVTGDPVDGDDYADGLGQTSVVYRAALYYSNVRKRQNDTYTLSCFVFVACEVGDVVEKYPAVILQFVTLEETDPNQLQMQLGQPKRGCGVYALLRFLRCVPGTYPGDSCSCSLAPGSETFASASSMLKHLHHAQSVPQGWTLPIVQKARSEFVVLSPRMKGIFPYQVVSLPCQAHELRSLCVTSNVPSEQAKISKNFDGPDLYLPISSIVGKATLVRMNAFQNGSVNYAFIPV